MDWCMHLQYQAKAMKVYRTSLEVLIEYANLKDCTGRNRPKCITKVPAYLAKLSNFAGYRRCLKTTSL